MTSQLTLSSEPRARDIDTDGTLLDDSSNPVQGDLFDFYDWFRFQGRLDAGTYYVKVAGNKATDTGRYTIRAIEDPGQASLANRCSSISRSAGISDPLYGCQWHLNNDNQFRNSAGQDIRVEEVWLTYTGSGINVAVVDHGMHYQHEDLTDNVLTAFNHNYDPDADRHIQSIQEPRHRRGRSYRCEGQQPRYARRSPRGQDIRIQSS